MQAQYSSKFTILMSLGIGWSVYRIVTEPPSWQAILIMVALQSSTTFTSLPARSTEG